ncbi:MAG: B12-binding domain-containing radical SAM protein, partial [Candidatus Omnitrophota bacterium]
VKLEEKFKPLGIKISLPSLRVGTFEERKGMDTLKRAGLTFAPEAGSERLRNTLNKKIKDEEIIEKSGIALKSGWRKVKLYFMIGLPGETQEDLDAIIGLVGKIKGRGQACLPPTHLSINPFIPKPHSGFEREGMNSLGAIKEKQAYLGSRLKVLGSRVRGDFHSAEMARIEAALARGDRRIGEVIARAWKKGSRFQAWTEKFNYKLWEEAFQETGIDPDAYLKKKNEDEILPWGFVK